jgi:hypothetical protein
MNSTEIDIDDSINLDSLQTPRCISVISKSFLDRSIEELESIDI